MNSTINKRYENFLKNNSEVKMLKDKIEQINVQKSLLNGQCNMMKRDNDLCNKKLKQFVNSGVKKKLKVQYGTKELEFKVEFKDRDTMSISVEPPNYILVVAPTGMPEEDIKGIVKSRGRWIVQKLFEFRNIDAKRVNREFVNGESFMYLGRNYSLQIHVDETLQNNFKVKLSRGKFNVYVKEKSDEIIKEAMESWYREKTEEQVRKRIKYYQKFFEKKPSDIKVRSRRKDGLAVHQRMNFYLIGDVEWQGLLL